MEKILEGISLEKAREILFAQPIHTETETVSIENCIGRVAAMDYYAPHMLPSFNKSPLDGYAFRSADTLGASRENPVTLRIIEEIPAGKAPEKKVHAGEAAKILTGAPIPEGADAVSRYEDTEFTEETVTLFSAMGPDTNIIHAGEDLQAGALFIRKGTSLTPPMAGLLASLGIAEVMVYKRPRVALISTGSELVDVKEPLTLGKIHNSSFYTLGGYLKEAGADLSFTGLARDTDSEIAEKISIALEEADLVITTGGVSVGDYDRVRHALHSLGAEILFWKLTLKPGAAFLAAVLHGKIILGLSGNPGSAAIALHLLGIPMLRRISGKTELLPPCTHAYAGERFPKFSHCDRYLRGSLCYKDGKVFFTQTGAQGNNIITSFVNCSALARIPAGTPSVEEGEMLEVYLI